jgi:hypothetical protein
VLPEGANAFMRVLADHLIANCASLLHTKIKDKKTTDYQRLLATSELQPTDIAGPAVNPVQVFRTGRANHWEFLRLWTGFELSSSWSALPCYGADRNQNILDFMRWPQTDLGAHYLNDTQRPKPFQKNSWK